MIHDVPTLGFVLDPAHEAHQPPEVVSGRRDRVRLLVSPGEALPVHARFDRLGERRRHGRRGVDHQEVTGPEVLLELHVAEEDVGRMIGRNGRVVNAMRTLAQMCAVRQAKRAQLEIV